MSSDNGPKGVNQPTARHRGNTANTASGHAKGRHRPTGTAKTPSNQQGSSGGQGRCPSPYDAATCLGAFPQAPATPALSPPWPGLTC